jgi:hypothetical protein
MPVVGQAKEIVEAREKEINEEGVRTYKRRYLVTCDSASDDANVALGAIGIPQRYSIYATSSSQDIFARCTEVSAKQVSGSFLHWHIDVTYSTKHGDKEKEEKEQDNPLLALPDVSWAFETIQSPIWFFPDQVNLNSTSAGHKASGPISTTAGEVFDPPPMFDESRPVVTIRRNEASFNPLLALEYQNSVNSDVFFGCKPRTAKLRSITADQHSEKGYFYWQVTYVIAFRRETWDLRSINYGSYYLVTAGSTSTAPFINRDGSLRFGYIKADGTALGVNPASSDVVANSILTFRIHIEKPFSSLNLPLSPNRT